MNAWTASVRSEIDARKNKSLKRLRGFYEYW